MGVDDEYKMVSTSGDDANDHLLERTAPISRSSYKKRNMFASIVIGAFIGATLMFVINYLFSPSGSSVSESSAAEQVQSATTATVTATLTATVTAPLVLSTSSSTEADTPLVNPVVADAAHTQKELMTDCGNTPAEARAKGCVFDVMMQLWTPPACYDELLSERYLAGGNWTWWADPEATHELSLDEMRLGEHPVIFVIQDYHKEHCIFAWEKLVRALRNEWPLIEELVSYDHVMHCKHTTLSKHSDEVRGVRAPTGYTRCGKYKDWEGRLPANAMSSVD